MSLTPNIGLTKPLRGSQRWDLAMNGNADIVDTNIGGMNNTIDDLPEIERHAETFNGSTGVAVSLGKAVDAVNEYGVEIVPTSRAGAIGDIWVTKGTSSFTVHCAESNTTDTFEAIVFHTGEMSSYGGSMYRRYYVSPSTSITDHSVAGTAGSLAYILNAMIGTSGIIELPGNRIYTLTANDVTIPEGVTLVRQPGAVISVASGKTLTFSGRFVADRGAAFSGDGDVSFENGSIDQAFPEWFGAIADGATDCGPAINKMAAATRSNCIRGLFGIGNYYTTESLDFTGANSDQGYNGHGWIIGGLGSGPSLITGCLAAGYPIVDMSDCGAAKLTDIRVQGDPLGIQLCGVLHGMVGTTLALQNVLDNVIVAGTFAEAAYINMSSDLSKLVNTYLDGPCGAIYAYNTSACGAGIIQSAYQTLTSTPNVTLHSIEGCQILGRAGDSQGYDSAIVMHEQAKIVIDAATYISQTGSAKAGIYVYGRTGTGHDAHTIRFAGRYENQTSPLQAGTFLWMDSQDALRNCLFDGFVGGLGSPDTGQWFYLQSGDITFSIIRLDPAASSEWNHVVQRAAATSHVIRDCEIHEQTDPSNLLDGLDAEFFGDGNIFHLHTWDDDWLNVSGICTFFTRSHGKIEYNPANGFNAIGDTGELARKYSGSLSTQWLSTATSGPAGSDETLCSWLLPGDIAFANTPQNSVTLKITSWGYVAANANAKTIKAKFGSSGSETTMVSNDISANPNNKHWSVEIEVARISTGSHWVYSSKMFFGSVLQTYHRGYISSDPSLGNTIFRLTGDGASNDIVVELFKVEIF